MEQLKKFKGFVFKQLNEMTSNIRLISYRKIATIIIRFILVAIGIFFLLIPSVANGFPILFSDVGTYIASGFNKFVPIDRPIIYGLFLRHTSLAHSLWFVIISQALISLCG